MSLLGFFPSTPAFRDRTGKVIPGSIAALEKFNLCGREQWVAIRGRSLENPVLLWLHGGPGGAETGTLRKYNPGLDDLFTVASWDQLGAGKSYSPALKPGDISLEGLVRAGLELAELLCKRFHQPKIFLVGHSFGSALGARMAQRRPDLFAAYIGCNQEVNGAEAEMHAYEYVLAEAHRLGKQKAIRDLERIGAPVKGIYRSIEGTTTQRRYMSELGGVSRDPKFLMPWAFSAMLAPEYSWPERLNYSKALSFSMNCIWEDFVSANFFTEIPEYAVPVYFVGGKYDHVTPAAITKRYLDCISAPRKDMAILDQVGHLAYAEDPQGFNAFLAQVRHTCRK
jgi:pimeloyl-ACP methyl ester carboxylesterase